MKVLDASGPILFLKKHQASGTLVAICDQGQMQFLDAITGHKKNCYGSGN